MCDQTRADGLTDEQRDYLAAVVAAAPPLSDDDIRQLRALLPLPSPKRDEPPENERSDVA